MPDASSVHRWATLIRWSWAHFEQDMFKTTGWYLGVWWMNIWRFWKRRRSTAAFFFLVCLCGMNPYCTIALLIGWYGWFLDLRFSDYGLWNGYIIVITALWFGWVIVFDTGASSLQVTFKFNTKLKSWPQFFVIVFFSKNEKRRSSKTCRNPCLSMHIPIGRSVA